MGDVWRGRHRALGRLVAVKLVRAGTLGGSAAQDEQVLRRFEREARVTTGLRSPHAIQVQDFGVADDGAFYLVMELLEGVDLQGLVERFGPMPPARVVPLLRQACDALAEAHAQGLVHRDIKPSNLFLCRSGTSVDFLKVLDFGLARPAVPDPADPQLTQAGAVPGSPAYLSPEVIRAIDPPGDKADVYALGCVAWWMLTGRLVFPARSSIEMVVSHLERTPGALAELVPGVPGALAELVRACLAKDPGARPTARELSRQLAGVATGPAWSEAAAEAWWDGHLPAGAGGAVAGAAGGAPAAAGAAGGATAGAAGAGARAGAADATTLGPLREAVYAELRRHFEQSRIDVGDLEGRLTTARTAASPEAVQQALAGLPASPTAAPTAAPAPASALAPLGAAAWRPMITVMSTTTRKGRWSPEARTRVLTVFGGTELDLRDAALLPGLTELRCVAVFGTATITLPPELYAEVAGMGVFGNFEAIGNGAARPSGNAPWVRITGAAVFGNVTVIVRPRRQGTSLGEVAARGAEVIQTVVDQITAGAARGRERARRRRLAKDDEGR
jgi:hypothetical protein